MDSSEDSDPPHRVPLPRPERGRGAPFNPANRFRGDTREPVDDGWGVALREAGDDPPARATTVAIQPARTIIARNESPDIPFTQSINPYQGCEHGCIYCYARPSHAYLDLSPGLDFETRLFAKPNAAALLRSELARPGYRCEPIALGANTDPYQPVEREWRLTRQVLEVLAECGHPVTITTKGALVDRDLDLLAPMAARGLVRVNVSLAMLDRDLARRLDPRAAAPHRRLALMRTLADAGVPVGVIVAPVIPQLTDKDIEAVLGAAADHGARFAGYTIVRLPREVAPLFRAWLDVHYPLRAAHVMSIIRDLRGGRDNDGRFDHRMRGQGRYAELIRQRVNIARRRHGLDGEAPALDTTQFRPRALSGRSPATPPQGQLDLF